MSELRVTKTPEDEGFIIPATNLLLCAEPQPTVIPPAPAEVQDPMVVEAPDIPEPAELVHDEPVGKTDSETL